MALVELGGKDAVTWSYQGDVQVVAASTYKLPLLMAEAQGIADGTLNGSDQLCYLDEDYQDGYYQDYLSGACYTRDFLALRAGQQSDNTAAHILVRYLGGADALNAYARAHGAQSSSFFDANVTTANDLARLWVSEASGAAGGQAAQAWLYPLLMNTAYEAGIPAGLSGATVVHKVGMIDDVVSDAALINGPHGLYVLIVCTAWIGGDHAWALIAQISAEVSQLEAARAP
jgi:beta-lactamase class A